MTIRHSLKVPPTLIHRVSTCVCPIAVLLLAWMGLGAAHPMSAPLPGDQANRLRGARLDRRIPMTAGSTLRIENPSGSIRVQATSEAEARLTAVRPAAVAEEAWYSITSSENPSGSVTVTIKPTRGETIHVEASVPIGVNVALKTEQGSIEIAGPVAGVVAESQAGDIVVQLPPSHSADLALHSTNGNIRSELPTVIFGLFDSHNVQAKLGEGGPAILLRTMSGNIRLLPLGSSTDLAWRNSTQADAGSGPIPADSRGQPQLRTSGEPSAGAPTQPSRAETSPRGVEGAAVRLESPLVNLNVSVSDSSGRAITDLTKDDFTVYEDDVRQEITHFAPATTPFDLVLLLDLSGSTEKKTKVIKQAAQRFVDLIKPEDRLAVFAFRRRVQIISHLTNDRDLLKRRIEDTGGGRGGTAFYDALWFTISELEQSPSRRKAIVVMTDGVDNSISNPEGYPAGHTFDAVLERLAESDMLVYPIYLDTEYEMVVQQRRETSEAYAVARRQLSVLAERTGGVLFRAERVEDLEGVYQQVANELRTVYSLAYQPSNPVRDGTWRRIRITVNRPTAAVRTKRGYYAR